MTKTASSPPPKFGMVECALEKCARCGKESKLWGELFFPEKTVADLDYVGRKSEVEGKKPDYDIGPPPANTWITVCYNCMFELGFLDDILERLEK